ncbi:hypothetical protein [Blastococcus sp. SYSU DS0973]
MRTTMKGGGMATDSAADRSVKRGRRHSEADIVIHTAEGAIVGQVKGLKGRGATERVIAQLLKGGPVSARAPRRVYLSQKPAADR